LRLLFIGLPLLELLGLMILTDRIGLPATLLEILLSCALGIFLIRRSGRSIRDLMQRFQKAPPNSLWSIIRPLQGILGGILMCLPGLLSDLIGLYLAISAGSKMMLGPEALVAVRPVQIRNRPTLSKGSSFKKTSND